MASTIEGPAANILGDVNFATVGTLNEDGSIHNTVVWVDVEDGKAVVNSAKGRVWPNNLERDPTITISVYNRENPYEYVEVRGKAKLVDDGDDAQKHIDKLAKKYMDKDEYPFRQEGEVRLKYVIEADKVRHAAG
jgi:PPOX class probable F420-dependent enzyme